MLDRDPNSTWRKATSFLVGMMGAARRLSGRALAQRLDREFADTDKVLVERTGVPVATIFEIEGEEGFRKARVGRARGARRARGHRQSRPGAAR
jgi:hypothetical protein